MSVNSGAKFNRRAFLGLCLGALTSFAFGNASILRGRNLFVYYTRTLNTHILAHYMQGLIGGFAPNSNTASLPAGLSKLCRPC